MPCTTVNGRDRHLDHLDQRIAQRLQTRADIGPEIANQRTERDPEQDLSIGLSVPSPGCSSVLDTCVMHYGRHAAPRSPDRFAFPRPA